jgi:hypothetical protein
MYDITKHNTHISNEYYIKLFLEILLFSSLVCILLRFSHETTKSTIMAIFMYFFFQKVDQDGTHIRSFCRFVRNVYERCHCQCISVQFFMYRWSVLKCIDGNS